jgi:hypothetical protein
MMAFFIVTTVKTSNVAYARWVQRVSAILCH